MLRFYFWAKIMLILSELTEVVKSDLKKVCEYVFLHETEFRDEYLSGSKKEIEKFRVKTKAEIKRLSERQEDIGRIIRKPYEDNVRGRITNERFGFLAKSYEDEGNDLKQKILELQNALSASVQDEEKLSKFLKVVKTYTEIQELTPEILNSFIEKIYIGETEKYDGRKCRKLKSSTNSSGQSICRSIIHIKTRGNVKRVGKKLTTRKIPQEQPTFGVHINSARGRIENPMILF